MYLLLFTLFLLLEYFKSYFIFILFYFCLFFVSLYLFFSSSMYRGSWRIYAVPVIAQHNGMTLYYYHLLLSTWYNVELPVW